MRPSTTLKRAAGVCLCVFAFSGSALADPGNGNGNGNGGTPPGQEKKAEQQAPPAAAPPVAPVQAAAQSPAPAKGQAKAKAKAVHKTEVKAQAKVHVKPKAKAEPKGHAEAAPKTTASKGRSAEAHHHVIICHRTGSASNPYVVINIPWTAWSEAHSPDTGSHPDLDGRHDVMLKDPASRPGSKDGFTKSSCGATVAPAGVVPTQAQPTDVCPNIEGMQSAIPAGLVKDASGNCVAPTVAAVTEAKVETKVEAKATSKSASAAARKTGTPTAAAAKAQTAAATAAKSEQPASGVLGETASAPQDSIAETATSGTLPFTGIPLWIAALIGAGLLTTGFALRRASQH